MEAFTRFAATQPVRVREQPSLAARIGGGRQRAWANGDLATSVVCSLTRAASNCTCCSGLLFIHFRLSYRNLREIRNNGFLFWSHERTSCAQVAPRQDDLPPDMRVLCTPTELSSRVAGSGNGLSRRLRSTGDVPHARLTVHTTSALTLLFTRSLTLAKKRLPYTSFGSKNGLRFKLTIHDV